MIEMPMQPIRERRFVPNRIVELLLNTHPNIDLNTIASIEFTISEREQFAQLIGYSLNGFSELSYVRDETYEKAELLAQNVSDVKDAIIKSQQEKINDLKKRLSPIIADLFNIAEEDLYDR